MTQEAIKMGMTAEDLAVIEKAYRENPDDSQVAELSASLEYTHQDAHVDVVIREIYQDENL